MLENSRRNLDLRAQPFSARGAYMCVIEDEEDGDLYLSITRSPEKHMQRKKLIRLKPVRDNKPLAFRYEASYEELILYVAGGEIRMAFVGDKQLRILGRGANLRLSFNIMPFENAVPDEQGGVEVAFMMLGKLLFTPLRGAIWHDAKWIPTQAGMNGLTMEFIAPIETGEYEIAVQERYTNPEKQAYYSPYADCVEYTRARFNEFRRSALPVNECHAEAARLAAYTIWSHIVNPESRLKAPAAYMSRTDIARASGMEQCLCAMACGGRLQTALDFILNFNVYQLESGQMPGYAGDLGISYITGLPPIHALALDEVSNISAMSCEALRSLTKMLSRQANWWLETRDLRGVPECRSASELISDMPPRSAPFESPELITFIALTCQCLDKLYKELGDIDSAQVWRTRTDVLILALIDRLWEAGRFVCRDCLTGVSIPISGAQALMPLLLAYDLPEYILSELSARVCEAWPNATDVERVFLAIALRRAGERERARTLVETHIQGADAKAVMAPIRAACYLIFANMLYK